ncbi:MAG: methyltransferase domain-containing protein [Myxococcales bacterium]
MRPNLIGLARDARSLLWRVEALCYLGLRFRCPICGWRFRKLMPTGGVATLRAVPTDHSTRNAICPRCRSDVRHRFAFQFLLDHAAISSRPQRVLHFAPEYCISKALGRIRGLDYVMGDLNPSRFARAEAVDITNIKFEADSFDGILCIHVLEHIRDDRRALAEIHRVLHPGGWALIAVPIYGDATYEDPTLDGMGRQREYGAADHMRMNGLDMSEKLKDSGFDVQVACVEDETANYYDRSERSPHTESDRYLFFCTKQRNGPR